MRGFALALLAAATLLAAGCGGGDDRLTESEFRQQANDACRDFNQQLNDLEEPTTPDQVSDYVSRALPLMDKGLDELRSINPPEDLEDDYDRLLDEGQNAREAAEKLQQAAEDQDPEALQQALEEGQQADEQSDAIATDLGLTDCASD